MAIVSYRVSGARYSGAVYLVEASLRMHANPIKRLCDADSDWEFLCWRSHSCRKNFQMN
jgi:hypothetical protein